MKLHETLVAERIARGWHMVWSIACFATLCNIIAAVVFIPASMVESLIAWHSLQVMLLGQAVLSLGGSVWHLFGAAEHSRTINNLCKALKAIKDVVG